MTAKTFNEIASQALGLVEKYCSPTAPFAWPLYDEDPSPETLSGADLTASALLSYPINGRYLNQFGQESEAGQVPNEYRALYVAMEAFTASPATTPARSTFHSLDREVVEALAADKYDHDGAPDDWRAFVRCLEAVQECSGLTSVAVTKILHRKRPDLVPINDSLVRSFYGAGRSYATLFVSIYDDLQNNYSTLDEIARRFTTPLGRPMTALRALDISVWMHMQGHEVAPGLRSDQ